MPKPLMALLLNSTLVLGPVYAEDNTQVIDAVGEYLDFVDYGDGTIFPEQIPAKVWLSAATTCEFCREACVSGRPIAPYTVPGIHCLIA